MTQPTHTSKIGTMALAALVTGLFAAPAAAWQASGASTWVSVVMVEDARDSKGDGIDDAAAARLGLDPDALDSDGDGIPDWWELLHGLDPLDPSDAHQDFDGGGLTNLEEYHYGTSPWKRDTTGNGWWDAFEVAWGADPADAENSPSSELVGDVNADGRVDAMDVQLVINAALGIPVPVPAKVTGVGPVNALDVQVVINKALGN